jgi:hypothetical protein
MHSTSVVIAIYNFSYILKQSKQTHLECLDNPMLYNRELDTYGSCCFTILEDLSHSQSSFADMHQDHWPIIRRLQLKC